MKHSEARIHPYDDLLQGLKSNKMSVHTASARLFSFLPSFSLILSAAELAPPTSSSSSTTGRGGILPPCVSSTPLLPSLDIHP